MRIMLPLSLTLLCLSGCSTVEGAFPSLAKRPFETESAVQATLPQSSKVNAQIADSLPEGLQIRVDGLMSRASQAQTDFDSALPGVRSIAASASGAVQGGENWVIAQMEVSRLDALRSDSVAALAELDGLISQSSDDEAKGSAILITPLLLEHRLRLAPMIDAQEEELDRLARQIGL
jgi:hypothetical protein